MENARDRQVHYANQHRQDVIFKEGEEVLLSTKNFTLPTGIAKKLSHKYNGPFKIIEVVSPTAYKLQLPAAWKRKHPVFHVSMLKKYTAGQQGTIADATIDELDEEDEMEYEVDRIIGERVVNRKKEYLVTWKGYPESEATWESHDNVQDLQVMDAYEKEMEEQTQVDAAKRSQSMRRDYIHDKWKYSHIQRWIKSLPVPTEFQPDIDKALAMMKALKYTGQEFVLLDRNILIEMQVREAAAAWMVDQIGKLYQDIDYPIKV
jgi:hypothetical protein